MDKPELGPLVPISEAGTKEWFAEHWEVVAREHACCKFWDHVDGAGPEMRIATKGNRPRTLRRFEHTAFSILDVFEALGDGSMVVFAGDSTSRVSLRAAM